MKLAVVLLLACVTAAHGLSAKTCRRTCRGRIDACAVDESRRACRHRWVRLCRQSGLGLCATTTTTTTTTTTSTTLPCVLGPTATLLASEARYVLTVDRCAPAMQLAVTAVTSAHVCDTRLRLVQGGQQAQAVTFGQVDAFEFGVEWADFDGCGAVSAGVTVHARFVFLPDWLDLAQPFDFEVDEQRVTVE